VSDNRRWVPRAVIGVIALLVVVGVLRIEHTTPLLLPLTLLVGAVVAIVGLVLDSSGIGPPSWRVPAADVVTTLGQDPGLAVNVRLIENHLSARTLDPGLPNRLARLADEALHRAGISRDDPSVEARLGPILTSLLKGAGAPRKLRPAEIDECLRHIEELTP
jgi:hypothetical protein